MIAKKIALSLGLAIVFPLLLRYGVSTFSPPPKMSDYAVAGGFDRDASPAEREQRREEWQARQHERQAAEKKFEQRLFAVAVPLGLAAIVVGAFLRVQAIGTGLMLGGIFSVCQGYMSYWSELPNALRFLSLLAAFIVLLLVGYRRIEGGNQGR